MLNDKLSHAFLPDQQPAVRVLCSGRLLNRKTARLKIMKTFIELFS